MSFVFWVLQMVILSLHYSPLTETAVTLSPCYSPLTETTVTLSAPLTPTTGHSNNIDLLQSENIFHNLDWIIQKQIPFPDNTDRFSWNINFARASKQVLLFEWTNHWIGQRIWTYCVNQNPQLLFKKLKYKNKILMLKKTILKTMMTMIVEIKKVVVRTIMIMMMTTIMVNCSFARRKGMKN